HGAQMSARRHTDLPACDGCSDLLLRPGSSSTAPGASSSIERKRFGPPVTAAGVRRRVARASMRPSTSTPPLAGPRLVSRLEPVVETDAHEGPVYVAEEDALY